jgi:acyl-homoserine-lactone acylase
MRFLLLRRLLATVLAAAPALAAPAALAAQGAAPAAPPATPPAGGPSSARATPPAADLARMRATAARVTIVRDRWGVAHVYGRSDADAVFGMIYAQAEDDFARVERNYINATGGSPRSDGEGGGVARPAHEALRRPREVRAQYARARWAAPLMDAWADGLNFYLATHPGCGRSCSPASSRGWRSPSPRGASGGRRRERSLRRAGAFYGPRARTDGWGAYATGGGAAPPERPRPGAPPGPPRAGPRRPGRCATRAARTASPSRRRAARPGHALLLINPHTSFYFRPEIHVVSDEGLTRTAP